MQRREAALAAEKMTAELFESQIGLLNSQVEDDDAIEALSLKLAVEASKIVGEDEGGVHTLKLGRDSTELPLTVESHKRLSGRDNDCPDRWPGKHGWSEDDSTRDCNMEAKRPRYAAGHDILGPNPNNLRPKNARDAGKKWISSMDHVWQRNPSRVTEALQPSPGHLTTSMASESGPQSSSIKTEEGPDSIPADAGIDPQSRGSRKAKDMLRRMLNLIVVLTRRVGDLEETVRAQGVQLNTWGTRLESGLGRLEGRDGLEAEVAQLRGRLDDVDEELNSLREDPDVSRLMNGVSQIPDDGIEWEM